MTLIIGTNISPETLNSLRKVSLSKRLDSNQGVCYGLTMTAGQKILLAEDDLDTRNMHSKTLNKAGFSVETAVDGQEALNKAKEGGYALIILDILMPAMTGIDVLNELKKTPPKSPNGPAVVLTNLGQSEIIEDALKAGAAAYFVKVDLKPQELVEKVKSVLNPK